MALSASRSTWHSPGFSPSFAFHHQFSCLWSLIRYKHSSLLRFYGEEQDVCLLTWKCNKCAAKEQHELQVSQVSLGPAAILSTWAQEHKTQLKKWYFPIITGDSKETSSCQASLLVTLHRYEPKSRLLFPKQFHHFPYLLYYHFNLQMSSGWKK